MPPRNPPAPRTPKLQTPYDFKYEKVQLTADRGGSIDLRSAVAEINIYEHLERNFLTGDLTIIDNSNMFEDINWQGTEKLEIEISRPDGDAENFKKKFIVTYIAAGAKNNDNAAVYLLNLIEDSYFISALQMLGKAYTGKPSEIINTILDDRSELNRTLDIQTPELQGQIRYIVPKIPPLKAISQLAMTATDTEGFPYYCYSALSSEDKLYMKNLKEMLQDTIAPQSEPFIYSQAATQKQEAFRSIPAKGKIIEAYRQANSMDTLMQIERGAIGSEWEFIDANQFVTNKFDYDFTTDVAKLRSALPANQNQVNYDENAFGGIHTKQSKYFPIMYTSHIYQDGLANLHDVDVLTSARTRATAHALRSHMQKEPLDIKLPGYHFFPEVDNFKTIGRSIPLHFLNNDINSADGGSTADTVDKKMSGQYVIHACRHHFTLTRYDVNITCVKFSNINTDQTVGN